MAQTIKLKRTATPSNVPTTAQLELGEVAINTYDGNVYIKKNNGADAIVKINANPSDLNYFINGTGTVAGTWLATDPDITSYYDGLVIWYRIGVAGASTTTLNINGLGAKTIYRYATAKLTTHWPVNSVIPLVYVAALNGGSFIGGYDWSDGNESYTVRWSQVAKNGSSIIHGYQLLMQGADNLMYPVTVGGVANSTTNVVQTAELRMGGQMLYYNSATDIAANGNISGNILYEGITSNELEYWSNRSNSTPWATAYLPMYLVGTINANGNIILDNSTTTAFLTQTLPTTANGKVYIQVGWTGNTTDNWRLSTHHPVFEFKGGSLRLYQKDGAGSGLDADLLDGQQGSYYYPASNPNGYTNDQTAAEILTAIKTVDGASSGLDADLLDGQQGSYYAPNSSLANYLPLAGGTLTGDLLTSHTSSTPIQVTRTTGTNINIKYASQNGTTYIGQGATSGTMRIGTTADLIGAGNEVWHYGNLPTTSVANWNTAYGWGDHSTQSYATQAYVGTAISNLVDSSPATLNTLNELAAALGDDPNFATTVTNSIATKLPLAGGTLTGGLTGTTAAFDSIYLNSNDRIYGGTLYRAMEASPTGTQLQLGEGYGLINMFKTQNAVSELKLWNNRQDVGNIGVSKVSGYNGVEVANMTFYRGGGGASGFVRFQVKPTNADVLADQFQIGDGSTAGYGVNVPIGGYRINGTTVIDSSRNLTNITSIDLPNANNWSYIKNNTPSGGLRFGTKNAAGTYSDQIEISATGDYVKLNRNTTVTGTITATDGNSTNWNTAYGWGDHASAGYLTSVSGYLPLTGGTLTGVLTTDDIVVPATKTIKFGASATPTFSISSSGTGTVLHEQGAGNFEFIGDNMIFRNPGAGSDIDYYAKFTYNGAAELYFDGTKTFETTATGIAVTGVIGASGTVTAPTFNATSTASGGFQGIDADTITAPSFTWTSDLDTGMWHSAANAIGFTTGGVNRITINSSGISGAGSGLTALNGSNISTGTVAAARVATLNQNTTGSSGSCTGNSATASAFNGTRTVSLTGDVTGTTTTWTGSGALSIATTIAANSVALGTDTTGNYVAGITAGSGMVVTGTAGEGWSPTVGLAALDLTLFPTSNYKKSVRVATTANITLSGVQTIDAIVLVAGNRVLVKNQTTASQNGIYIVAAGAWTRSTAADGSTEIDSAVVGVESGNVNGGLFFTNVFKSTDVLNTTAMPWYKVTTDLDQSTTNVGNKIVQRDASGNFSAGTITATAFSGSGASLSALNGSNITTGTVAAARVATLNQSTTGNAATATALQTARTINGVSFNGTANITVEPYIEDDEGTDATRLLVFTDDTTAGFKRLNEDSGLTYNPLNNLLRSNSINASNFYVGTATTGAYITSPYTLGNLGLNAGSTAYNVFIGAGATNYAQFSNTLITHYSRLYSAPNTSQTASTPNFESRAQGSGNGVAQYHMSFTNSTGAVNGRITTNNFGTTYATTSDYRVKEDLQEMEDATSRLLQLKPINFRWVGSEDRTDGFLAHEVKEIVHDAVVGEKDATETVVEIVVDEEGNETEVTKVVDSLQALDQAKLVPLLVKTIQELEARIRALEAK